MTRVKNTLAYRLSMRIGATVQPVIERFHLTCWRGRFIQAEMTLRLPALGHLSWLVRSTTIQLRRQSR